MQPTLVHGSYGIERDSIVLTEALELAHLDFDEFLASYEGMTLALTHISASSRHTAKRGSTGPTHGYLRPPHHALLRSNINDLISSAEHPEKMLNQIIVDMRSQLVKAKQQVAAAIADEKRLRDQADGEQRQAQDWENRAVLAVRSGQDDLAKAGAGYANGASHARAAARDDVAVAPRRDREAQERVGATSTTRSRKRSARRTC